MAKVQFKYAVRMQSGYVPVKYKTKTVDVPLPVDGHGNIAFGDLGKTIEMLLADAGVTQFRVIWYRVAE